MASVKNPAPVRRPPAGNVSQAPGARAPNAFERAARAAGLPIAGPVPANVARNPLQGGRRKTRRGGKPPRASRESESPVLVDMYVLLDRTPTRESLVQVANEIDELTEPAEKVREYKTFVRGLRGVLDDPAFNLDHVVRTAKQQLAERILSDEEKELIRSKGVEVSARNMWQAGRRRRKTRKSRKM